MSVSNVPRFRRWDCVTSQLRRLRSFTSLHSWRDRWRAPASSSAIVLPIGPNSSTVGATAGAVSSGVFSSLFLTGGNSKRRAYVIRFSYDFIASCLNWKAASNRSNLRRKQCSGLWVNFKFNTIMTVGTVAHYNYTCCIDVCIFQYKYWFGYNALRSILITNEFIQLQFFWY